MFVCFFLDFFWWSSIFYFFFWASFRGPDTGVHSGDARGQKMGVGHLRGSRGARGVSDRKWRQYFLGHWARGQASVQCDILV